MATRTSISFLRAVYPRAFARMVYQVGNPAMFDGNRFFPETGTPIWKIDRISTRFAVWLPDPLTVATWIEQSLMTAASRAEACAMDVATSERDMQTRTSGETDEDTEGARKARAARTTESAEYIGRELSPPVVSRVN